MNWMYVIFKVHEVNSKLIYGLVIFSGLTN